MRHLYALPVLLLALTFAACEGAEGPAGAVGPEGPQGPSGPSGPQGPPGNTNIQSFNFDYDDSSCSIISGVGVCFRTWSGITQRVVDEGAVFGYLSTGDGWAAIPLTIGDDFDGDGDVDATTEYAYQYEPGAFQLEIRFGDGPVGSVGSGTVRVVAMAGPNGFLRGEEPPPYSELASRFGLSLD